jgi:hypothetical protein
MADKLDGNAAAALVIALHLAIPILGLILMAIRDDLKKLHYERMRMLRLMMIAKGARRSNTARTSLPKTWRVIR